MRWLALPLLLAALSGCGDDASTRGDVGADAEGGAAPSDPTAAGTDAGSDQPASAGPLYVLHTATQNPEGTRTNFFALSRSLTEPQRISYTGAIELPGRARLYAQPDLGFLAIGDSERLSITRYDLAGDKLQAGASISLQPYGVTSMGARAVHFVSATKAYYKDVDQAQIIVWNPTQMAVERSIELPDDVIKEGFVTNFSDFIARDGQVYFAVGWTTRTYDKVLPGAKLVRIDSATDAVTVSDDARCRGMNKVANLDGTLYFFSDVINAFGHAVYPGDGGQPDCALRVAPGQTTFDASYVGSLGPVLRPDQRGTIVDVTSDGQAWAQVADLTVAPTMPGATYNEWYAAGWSWYKAPLPALQGATPVGGEAGAYSGFTVTDGTSFLIAQTKPDYSETTLMDLSAGSARPGISFSGFPLGAARLR